jgi:hypothetical protein
MMLPCAALTAAAEKPSPQTCPCSTKPRCREVAPPCGPGCHAPDVSSVAPALPSDGLWQTLSASIDSDTLCDSWGGKVSLTMCHYKCPIVKLLWARRSEWTRFTTYQLAEPLGHRCSLRHHTRGESCCEAITLDYCGGNFYRQYYLQALVCRSRWVCISLRQDKVCACRPSSPMCQL